MFGSSVPRSNIFKLYANGKVWYASLNGTCDIVQLGRCSMHPLKFDIKLNAKGNVLHASTQVGHGAT